MHLHMHLRLLALIGCSLAGASSSFATERALTERLVECVRERDDARRLACFDRATAQLDASSSKGASVTAEGGAPSASDFGVSGSEVARKRGAAGEENAPPEVKRLDATVAAIARQPRGELVLTLDNGQVWVQKTATSYFPVEVGDQVTIMAGALSSYRLMTGGRSTAVTRIK
jgi:hypothetical protein